MANTSQKKTTQPKKTTQAKVKQPLEEMETINLDEVEQEIIIDASETLPLVNKDKVLGLVADVRKQCYKCLTLSRSQVLTLLDKLSRNINELE